MQREPTFNRPPGWIGGVLELPPVLACSAAAAIGVRWAVAYPQGLAITFLRLSPRAETGWTAYGSKVSRGTTSVAFDDAGPQRRSSGGGSDGALDVDEWWLSPLPAHGGFEIVVAWPEQGIAERRLRVEAAVLADAVARARPIAGVDG